MGVDKIHLMCIRPEKNNNTYNLFDPSLQNAEIRAFKNTRGTIQTFGVVVNIRNKGPIFCQVRNRKALALLRKVMKGAPQKCKGAILAFNNSPTVIHLRGYVKSANKTPDNAVNEPILCTTKYIIADFFIDHFVEIITMNDIRLTSIISHTFGHPSAEIAPKVPSITPVHI